MTTPATPVLADAEPPVTVAETSTCNIAFNVMPGRPIEEELRIREYRIGKNWIEAEFDRSYHSSMRSSPSHLTFVSALIQMQKVAYVYACHHFGLDSNVTDEERLKLWPTKVNISMKDMVREEHELIHRVEFTTFRRVEPGKYLLTVKSNIGILEIDATAMLFLLQDI